METKDGFRREPDAFFDVAEKEEWQVVHCGDSTVSCADVYHNNDDNNLAHDKCR